LSDSRKIGSSSPLKAVVVKKNISTDAGSLIPGKIKQGVVNRVVRIEECVH